MAATMQTLPSKPIPSNRTQHQITKRILHKTSTQLLKKHRTNRPTPNTCQRSKTYTTTYDNIIHSNISNRMQPRKIHCHC